MFLVVFMIKIALNILKLHFFTLFFNLKSNIVSCYESNTCLFPKNKENATFLDDNLEISIK